MKRMMILTGVTALAFGMGMSAQEDTRSDALSPAMTLQECLAAGLQNNYDLRMVRDRQQITENDATIGNAGFLPTLDLSSGFSGTLNNVEQDLRAGGTVKNNGINNNTLSAGVNLNWTVFDGFSVQTTYKRLNELRNMGELNTRLAVENYVTTLVAGYYDYIRQLIRLRNMHNTIALSEERVRIVEVGYEIGSNSRPDLLQAKLDLNSDKSALMQQYETLHALRTRLNELMAIEDINSPLTLADSVISYGAAFSLDNVTESMFANNIYLLLASKDRDISGLDLKLVQSRNYPYLRMNGGYGYTQNWYETGTNNEQRTLGLNYGLTLGINLFDGFNKRRQIRNARIEEDINALSYEQTEQGLRKDLSDAWMAYRNNMRLTEMEKTNLELAQDNYTASMELYKEYQLSGIELREAQNKLLAAEERLVQAEYNTKMCEVTLLQIAGKVMLYLD